MTHINHAIHVILATIVLALTPASAAFSYSKPTPAPSIEVGTATSGSVPR